MKTSLGDDHALIYLDYDAVKEVVLIYRVVSVIMDGRS